MSRPFESSDEPSREEFKAFVSAQDWGKGFGAIWKRRSSNPARLEAGPAIVFRPLRVATKRQTPSRDLQHYNVLFDSDRGWLAIDPKGVIGEVEYEIGASLRNPV